MLNLQNVGLTVGEGQQLIGGKWLLDQPQRTISYGTK